MSLWRATLVVVGLLAPVVGAVPPPPRPAGTLTVLADGDEASATVALECTDAVESGRCEATITVSWPDGAAPATVFVGGPGTSALRATVGRVSGEILSGAQANERFCGAMMGQCPVSDAVGLVGVKAANGRVVAVIDLAYRASEELDSSVAAWRHPWVTGTRNRYRMEGPVDLVVAADALQVQVTPPSGFDVPGLDRVPRQCPGAPCRVLLSVVRDAPFRPGGPLVGIGARFDDDGEVRLAARLGYEIAAPSWLLIGLNADTDFHQFGSLALTGQAGFGLWIHAALGVGPVLELAPELRGGIRFTGGLGAFFGTLVGSFDVFPEPDGIGYRGLLLLQAGF